MKKMTRIMTLLLALMTILVMSQAAFALDSTLEGGTYTYDGDEITTDNPGAIQEALSGMEPGDSVTINQTYVNESDNNTEWYLRNEVLDAFEKASEEGGYTYILTSGGVEIFNSDQVGGADAPDASDEKGLQLATDATGEWIHIDSLGPGESGETTLYVALDGESQANVYQSTDSVIELQYAVEDEELEDVIKHVPGKGVNTGDSTNMLLPIMVFLGAALLLVLALVSYRKDKRKDGEQA